MRPDRVVKLPVFRTMFFPVAQKAWKCDLCKEPVEVEKRYVHYFDRRTHEIINYRFHRECWDIVQAYCLSNKVQTFTPLKARNWVKREFCVHCPNECAPHPCNQLMAVIGHLLRNKART